MPQDELYNLNRNENNLNVNAAFDAENIDNNIDKPLTNNDDKKKNKRLKTINQMKTLYLNGANGNNDANKQTEAEDINKQDDAISNNNNNPHYNTLNANDSNLEPWENEVEDLVTWTKNLNEQSI